MYILQDNINKLKTSHRLGEDIFDTFNWQRITYEVLYF